VANCKHTPSERPIKPWPDFPLFPHSTGRRAKKIDGKTHYFGPWNDPEGAYNRYLVRQVSETAVDTPAAKTKAKRGPEANQLDRTTRPRPGFPLFPHRSGQWAKRIRGKTHYFGTNAQAAFKLYQDQKADLEAGRTPKPTGDYHLNVKDMVNLCLTLKETKVETGELDRRTYKEYQRCGRRLMRILGRMALSSV
jgi:hypothetical protein